MLLLSNIYMLINLFFYWINFLLENLALLNNQLDLTYNLSKVYHPVYLLWKNYITNTDPCATLSTNSRIYNELFYTELFFYLRRDHNVVCCKKNIYETLKFILWHFFYYFQRFILIIYFFYWIKFYWRI